MSGSRRRLAALLRLLGPALLVVVLVRIPDRGAVAFAIASASLPPLGLALLLNPVNVWLKIVRWQALLATRGIRYPHRRAWAAFLASLYLGILTPARVGDVLRVQYLRHDVDVPYSEGLASVVMDRFCDLYVLAAFSALGVARYGSVLAGDLAWIAWGGVAATVIAPLSLLAPGIADRLARTGYRALAGSEPSGLATFLKALRANVGASLLVTIPLTVATFLVHYAQGWLVARAIGLDLSVVDVTCLLAITSLLGLLPISISGVGVRELFFALVFPALGFTAAQGVSFGLLVFTVTYLALAALGLVGWQIAPPPGPGRAP